MTLGEKIKLLLKERMMTKRELAKKLRFRDSSVISHWTSGRFYPSFQSKKRLAQVFERPLDYFENDKEAVVYDERTQKGNLVMREKPQMFPSVMHVGIIGAVTADSFSLAIERTPSGYLPILMEIYADKRIFALKLESDCLFTLIGNENFVIIEQTGYVESGELAMVELNGRYTVRRVVYCKDTVLLKSDNPSLKTLRFKPNEIKVIGRVKGFFRKP